ncbi:nickel-dependent hydrogenase large subunit [Hydrogenibacillus schlegelii]|uniref:Cytochrome-c3 hydrogenase n=1 Tax=Hydrogenibacillus schlegelii TaxID=1484 RepID=A0A132N852_HYDSH|nr:nickel-dependent hydrogenase large subunit [Hydrogenibacillus schlegelii]KWX06289.1 cytochrome-c3 hydrogenase [Hydrogenibacillus schlegelii]OAR03347.1 cytochrome-c3 hydrogenase [Hydrogenibacillus schlegelii]
MSQKGSEIRTIDRKDLKVHSLGRVEGDLDVRVAIENGVVVDAWTEATMFRGFEIILKGKDPQAGLIVTPRICGICGGSHLTKAVYAIDTAWSTEVPPNATLVRNIAQAVETLQSMPRWFYALFAIGLTHENYKKSPLYDEVVKRWAPFTGTSYEIGVIESAKPVEIYAIFGGQWPHSSFMVPGGVMCAPTLSDVTRSISILEHYREYWLEKVWLGCSVERWLENKTWKDVLNWLEEKPEHRDSDLGLFIRYSMDIGLDKYGRGPGRFIAMGSFFEPDLYRFPTIEGRNRALISRSGVYDGENFHDFDQMRVREDHTYSFFRGGGAYHPFDGVTEPIDPQEGAKEGKYTWAKAPRYDVPGIGELALEAGPLARQVIAGRPGAEKHQDYDPLIFNIVKEIGPSVMVRVLARMHEAPKYYLRVKEWLRRIDLNDKFYIKPKELPDGRGFGATEAARGALADWIVLKDGKIENYQVITPTAWNIGPRDRHDQRGPIETAMIGTPIRNPEDPVELAHIAQSYDSCLVCTVHAYDAKTKQEIAKYEVTQF